MQLELVAGQYLDVLGAVGLLADAHGDDKEFDAVAEPVAGGGELRVEDAADGAPGGPELDEDGLPSDHAGEVHRVALEVLDREGLDHRAGGDPLVLRRGAGGGAEAGGGHDEGDRHRAGGAAGAGGTVDRAAVQAHRDLTAALRDRVAAMVKQGRTQEEVMAAKPLAEFDAKVQQAGTTGERFLGQLYAELSGAK